MEAHIASLAQAGEPDPQLRLLDAEAPSRSISPPQTRYQGSKRKILPWLWSHLKTVEFNSALDAFAGSGSVSYWLKAQGKTVTHNDLLPSSFTAGLALVENSAAVLEPADVNDLLKSHPGVAYDDFIQRTFHDVFFLDEENAWLDRVIQNISRVQHPYKRAIGLYALFQACLVKRPYNLFHRANLYMRTARVPRSFGNKTTWDKPFDVHFRHFVQVANAAVFDNGAPSHATCVDAATHPGTFDLVYIDPPYMNGRGVGTDYGDYYHFLDGLCHYEEWPDLIDRRKRHLPLKRERSPWLGKNSIAAAFDTVLDRFASAVIAISYRSDGTPSIDQLMRLLKRYKANVSVHRLGEYKYVLSTNHRSEEVLLIGQ